MYNNPAFQMFLMATLDRYWAQKPEARWQTGADKMLIVSVGTGTSPDVRAGLEPSDMNLLFNATTIPSALMFAALNEQDLLCRVFGDCRAGDPIDREIGDLIGSVGPLGARAEAVHLRALQRRADSRRPRRAGVRRHRARNGAEARLRRRHPRPAQSWKAGGGAEGPCCSLCRLSGGLRTEQSAMPSIQRAFVVMPFGQKKGPDGVEIDCDAVYRDLLEPAISAAGLAPHRADADRRGGSIHLDMFQDLLLAEFVVADLTLDNPNVWYEIGVRHALRAGGSVLMYALRERLPFDIAGQRMQRYTLTGRHARSSHIEGRASGSH